MELIECYSCHEHKDPQLFYPSRRRRGKDGKYKGNLCTPCSNLERKKAREIGLSEHRMEYHRKRAKVQRSKYPEKHLLRRAKSRARIYNLNFNLTLEDIVIPERCPILGIRMKVPSIDRIENDKGYVKGNIVICSMRANRIKSDATFKEIKKLYLFLKNHHVNL